MKWTFFILICTRCSLIQPKFFFNFPERMLLDISWISHLLCSSIRASGPQNTPTKHTQKPVYESEQEWKTRTASNSVHSHFFSIKAHQWCQSSPLHSPFAFHFLRIKPISKVVQRRIAKLWNKGKFSIKRLEEGGLNCLMSLNLTSIKMNVTGWFKLHLWMWLTY